MRLSANLLPCFSSIKRVKKRFICSAGQKRRELTDLADLRYGRQAFIHSTHSPCYHTLNLVHCSVVEQFQLVYEVNHSKPVRKYIVIQTYIYRTKYHKQFSFNETDQITN